MQNYTVTATVQATDILGNYSPPVAIPQAKHVGGLEAIHAAAGALGLNDAPYSRVLSVTITVDTEEN